ncbi:lipoamide acyltransferase component of branched-chain alpha-keto acid dehydrogenase complex, mitochondrial isoform X2 [Athalia rosae]|uniref:lipoamide acyltransferase component of branched-chain alpha-keto acid dehydrogenase complex, mitochondrial isoform X2 n=1 Tax=Athalia rosae TaxID=37344 RepID=UPI002033BCBF|nr:lipoamide acyltransferase component of branched-chain alpha-keto acid dehydrogenase complex, mitochondrial isoform X2 [Athalia rosae]
MNIVRSTVGRSGQSNNRFTVNVMAVFVRHLAAAGFGRSKGGNTRFENVLRTITTSFSLRGRIVPYKLSDIGEGIREVTIKEWFVKQGDKVSQFDNICEVQSDKASVTITSRYDGLVKALRFKVDEIALVGQPLVDIELEGDEGSDEEKSTISSLGKGDDDKKKSLETDAGNENVKKVLTTPAVRKIAAEKGINLATIVGSGKDGRILKEDLLNYTSDEESSSDSDVEEQDKIKLENSRDIRGVRSVEKKIYAKHMWSTMTQSLSIPHFVYSDEYDITKLVEFREGVKDQLKEQGVSLSYMPFFIKAISRALEKYPELNARIKEESKTVEILSSHNISVATDTPGGLVVPNIKNVQNLDVIGIAKELNRLQDLGKRAAFSPSDLSGGTFSLSNIGVIGGTYTKPVILSPQIMIGAIGRTQKLPRFDENDQVVAAHIIFVSWAADHRVVDGATVARFSNQWKYYLNNPALLAMNG